MRLSAQRQTELSRQALPSLLLVLLLAVPAGLCAQRKHVIDTRMNLKSLDYDAEHVYINYGIPYAGMVELKILSNTDPRQVIYRDQQIRNKGNDFQMIVRKRSIKPGKYEFLLVYKGNIVRSDMVVTPPPKKETPAEPETTTSENP